MTEPYKTDTVFKDFLGEGDPTKLERLIGKTVKRIENYEHNLRIIFTDDTFIESEGCMWDDGALGGEIQRENE